MDAARRAALAEDPRLVRILDVGSQPVPGGHATYVISEHVNGRTLATAVAAAPLPAEAARRLVGEASQALARAGSRGLHHLCLDPSTVWITNDGSVKVSGTAIDAAVSGIEYETSDAAEHADAVGLVHVLYAALTGRWPGGGRGGLEAAPQVNGRPVPPGDLSAGVPNDLDTLCAVTLGPDDDGPRTPAELADQLAPWARSAQLTDPHGLALGARRPTPRPAPKPVQHPPVRPAARPAPPSAPPASGTDRPGTRPAGRPTAPPVAPAATAAQSPAAGRPGSGRPTAPQHAPQHARGGRGASAPAAAGSGQPGTAVQTPPAEIKLPSTEVSSGVGAVEATRSATSASAPGTSFAGPSGPAAGATAAPAEAPSAPAAAPAPAAPDLAGPVPGTAPAQPGGLGGAADLFRPAPGNGTGYRYPGADDAYADVPFGVLGTAGRNAWTGLGRPEDGEEYLGPFLPPAPLTRPSRDQSRLVLGLVAVAVVALLVFALWSLRDFGSSGGGSVQTVPSAAPTTASASSTPSAAASGSATAPATTSSAAPPVIDGIRALDPLGDQTENDQLVSNAVDGNPATAWRTDRYNSQTFGGLKAGLGLAVRLADRAQVTEVDVDTRGSDGVAELRVADGPDFAGSTVVATGTITDGKLVLKPSRPVATEWIIIWVTRLPDTNGGQLYVSEIKLR